MFMNANRFRMKKNNDNLLDDNSENMADKTLNESEKSYFGLFNTVTEAIYIQDETGIFLDVNNGATKMYGYSREEFIGQTPEFVSAPGKNDLKKVINVIERVAATGYPETFEFWGLRKNGEIFPKEVVCNKGIYFGKDVIISTARDITELKQADEAVRNSEEKYRLLLEMAVDAFFQGDANGNFIEANNKAVDLTGYSREELLKMNMRDLFSKETLQKESLQYDQLKQGKTLIIEREVLQKNGKSLSVEMHSKIMPDGSYQSFFRDITERKLAENALRESEKSYIGLFNSVTEAIYIHDKEGTFIDINEGALKMYGYTREELIGRNPEFVSAPGMNDLEEVAKIIKGVADTGQHEQFEFWGLRKNGEIFPKEIVCNKGMYFGYDVIITTARDITRRKKIEEELNKERILLKTFIDNIPISFFIKDRESRKILSNHADQANSQKTAEELIGKTDFEVFSTQEAEGFVNDDKFVMENDTTIHGKEETILNRNDGSIKYMSTTKMPLKNESGEIIGIIGFSIDITERKKIEEALRESEKRFRALFENSPDAIILADIDSGIIIDANTAASRMLTRTVEEIRGMHQADIHPSRSNKYSKESFRFQVDKLLERNEYHPLENFILQSDGTEIPVEILASLISINGKPVLQGVFRDITERKRTEEALQQSKARLDRGELVSKTGNWELYLDSGTILASEGARKLYGWDRLQANIEDVKNAAIPEYRPLLDNTLLNLIEKSEPYNVEYKINKIGTKEYVDINSIAEYDREKNVVFGVIQDITERKRSEQIQKVLYNISGAVNTSNDIEAFMSIIQTELGTLLDTTNFYVASFDETTDMLTSLYCMDENDDVNTWPAKDSLTGYVVMNNKPLLIKNNDISKHEWLKDHYQIGTNSEVWLGVPLREEGKVTGAFVVQSYTNPNAYDEKDVEMLEFISDQISISIHRKKVEQAIIAAKEKAEESDRLKTAFLANMSHEIRTPMNGILGFAELLDDNTLSPERRREFTSIISSSSKQLLTVINDIIDISKIESGQLIISNVKFNLNKLMHEVHTTFENLKSTSGKSHIKLVLEKGFSDDESNIFCDDMRLSQILNNLLGNALKFTSSGFVKFGYNRQDDNLLFFVEDTGKGIDKDKQQFVFERFRQVEESNTRRFGGTGLGLSISKGLVELMDGSIWVVSEEDKGSIFYFTLPLIIQSPLEISIDKKKLAKPENGFYGKTILIAEDIQSNFHMIQIMLEKMNAVLLYAEDGSQAVDICRNETNIDLVLMDIQMPVMNGYDATREIRNFRPQLPIIALTAFAYEEDKIRCIDAGCNDFISKPIEKYELITLMSKYLIK
jgi:PAS domain S-box-containing protein